MSAQASDTVAAGLVLTQFPAAGVTAAPLSAVTLVLSSGPAPVAVPNVIGTSQSAAQAALSAHQLALGAVNRQASSVSAGVVVSESPAAGSSVAPGSAVSLIVSSGPAAVAVPDVTGTTQIAAQAALSARPLALGAVSLQTSSTTVAGLVLAQTPPAGAQVSPGTSIALTVSSGPSLATVPAVTGKSPSAATTALNAAGLTVGTLASAASSSIAAGFIVSESPAAGSCAPAGSAVNLVVSSGAPLMTVPSVRGETLAAATATITAKGLSVGSHSSAPSSTVKAGAVISQSPSAGTQAAKTTKITLVLSSGPAPMQVSVPSLSGLTESAATQSLAKAGLSVGSVTSRASTSVAAGKVVGQNPNAGTKVLKAAPVNLVISTG